MGKIRRDSYAVKQRKQEAARKRKHTELDRSINSIDAIIRRALEPSGAYHTGEIAALNTARGALFSIRGGFVSKRR